MNPANRDMEVEDGWDMACNISAVIESTDFAVLQNDEVLMVVDSDGETLNGITLTNERGLHYDGDTSVRKAYCQRKVEHDDWSLTTNWLAIESHLQ